MITGFQAFHAMAPHGARLSQNPVDDQTGQTDQHDADQDDGVLL